ncbi:putative phospholipid-transporting ATPase IH [Melipona quadrifasciata]|uniref:Phospholipid-transporting ATPase n=1 Tax=Melipona quadrifasciata TaxID=166423 RepID=A0A0N0U6J1_9HYME|nr:putative phospholipid-transporting ATPase IH [Melipona quadrifasciata]
MNASVQNTHRRSNVITGFLINSNIFVQGNATSLYTDHRIVTISPSNDPEQTIFPNNRIISKKYTLWNFVPKNLFEQFRRIANFYFLIMTIISVMITSPISPLTSVLPLSFVILVTACKQGYEDYNRYMADKRVNRTFVKVIRNKCVQNIHCEEIVVGDLVKVYREQDVPCDLLLLFSTEDTKRCYITTSNLDGETNLKSVMVPKILSKMTMSQIVSMEATVTCQHPSSDLYNFHGKLEINNKNNEVINGYLTINNLLLRGSRLKDTDHIIGCAIYTGHDTKLSLNSKIRSNKFSTAEKSINKHIAMFIVLLLVEVIESCMMKIISDAKEKWEVYLSIKESITFKSLITDFLSFTILYNYIVPISLYVTIELQKFLGSFFFVWDIDMYDEVTNQSALINTSDLNEELGQVEYLFTDKTGTLTENLMVFRRASINGKVYTEKNCDGNLYLLPSNGDDNQAVKLETWETLSIKFQPDIWHFMISISLCHSVQISPPSQKSNIIRKRTEYRESFKQKRILQLNSSLLMDPDLPEYQLKISDHYAVRGFRTLVVGYKRMNQIEYDQLLQKVEQARQIIGIERAVYMERAYNQMENGLTLLGVTGIEDRLQEGVPETLECLQVAGIKVWVLTGDKAETAENIAFLCGQFKSGTEILRFLEITSDQVCSLKLMDFERRIRLEPNRQYGLLVDGYSIATALKNHAVQFRSIAMSCDAVVCSRLTPLQKSQIVSLVKNGKNGPHTAAIGDGGNDVSMIQEAHVGIGIMGKEGRQATMCSDFAIARFKFLKKALLVHGHWYYVRISTLTQFFFYKNFIFITPQVLYNTYTGFSAQPFYDALFFMLYNVIFTSMPILVYGLFEQNFTADKLLRKPYLYKLHRRNYLLTRWQFLLWTALALWHSLTIYYMSHVYISINPVTLYNNTPVDQWTFGTFVFHLVTLVANLQVLLRSCYWTLPLILIVTLSELTFIAFTLFYSFVPTRYDGDILRVFPTLLSSITFWLLTIMIVIVCLIPDCLLIVYNKYRPARVMRRNEEPRQHIISNNVNDDTENVLLQIYHKSVLIN